MLFQNCHKIREIREGAGLLTPINTPKTRNLPLRTTSNLCVLSTTSCDIASPVAIKVPVKETKN